MQKVDQPPGRITQPRTLCQKAELSAGKQHFPPESSTFRQKAKLSARKQNFLPESRTSCQKAELSARKQSFLPESTIFRQKAELSAGKHDFLTESHFFCQKAELSARRPIFPTENSISRQKTYLSRFLPEYRPSRQKNVTFRQKAGNSCKGFGTTAALLSGRLQWVTPQRYFLAEVWGAYTPRPRFLTESYGARSQNLLANILLLQKIDPDETNAFCKCRK